MPNLVVGEEHHLPLRVDADSGDPAVVGPQRHRSPGLDPQRTMQKAADQVAVTDKEFMPVLSPGRTEEAGKSRLDMRSGLRLRGRVGPRLLAIAALSSLVETGGKALPKSAGSVQCEVGKVGGDDRRRLCRPTVCTGVQGSEMDTESGKPFAGQLCLRLARRDKSLADPRVAEIAMVVFAMPNEIESPYCHWSVSDSAPATVCKAWRKAQRAQLVPMNVAMSIRTATRSRFSAAFLRDRRAEPGALRPLPSAGR